MKPRGSASAPAEFWSSGAPRVAGRWRLAEETPVAILINSRPVTVMMATPADLEDMAVGFLLAEGYVAGVGAMRRVMVLPLDNGFSVDVAADESAVGELPGRALEGRTGCGLCGLSAISDLSLQVPYRRRAGLDGAAVAAAFSALAANQPLRRDNLSVHGAGFAAPCGRVSLVREDVGRHNALDKLIGALACESIDPAGGFAVLSSRCSFELVRKAAIAGLGGLASLSAPTRLALQIAECAGLPLASRAPAGVALFQGWAEQRRDGGRAAPV